MILFFYFFLIFIFFFSKSKLFLFLVLIQIVSLLGLFLIDASYEIKTFFDLFNLIFTIVLLSLIIFPWVNFFNIKTISVYDEKLLSKVSWFLIIISIPTFLILLTTSILVSILVENVNEFKYTEGVSMEFYYSLPFDVRAFILSSYLYIFGFFLIPLHFFYLTRNKLKLSILCLFLSFNVILYGLTFFSRAVFAQYFLIYFSFLILFHESFELKIKKAVNVVLIFISLVFFSYFIYLTSLRFSQEDSQTELYSELIPFNSIIKDPAIYSIFDYLSQWYSNSLTVLSNYKFETFKGQISTQSVISLLGQYGLIDYKPEFYFLKRMELWPDHWYLFNGFAAYIIYDFGYFFSFIMCLCYFFIVRKIVPKNGVISIDKLFLIVLLIQIPLLSIFYSAIPGIFIPLIFFLIYISYSRIKL